MPATSYLSPGALRRINGGVQLPGYERADTRIGVVHFGPGAFHRVHQACYFDDLLHEDRNWAICGVSLRTSAVRDALLPQDGLYTLAVLDEEPSIRVIGALREILVAAENPAAVFARVAAPDTRLVTATVTEKGYCLASDGSLDFDHPDIQRDLRAPQAPASLVGYLVEGLRWRREAQLPPVTVLCCDNLADNGRRLRGAVVQLASVRDKTLGDWIDAEIAFPGTMVDSITPATDEALRSRVHSALGVEDRWPVQREAFVQWVIESDARSSAPDLRSVGVTVTDNIAGYERAKLRLLNGAHSTLAYLGILAGLRTVAEAMSNPTLAGFVRSLMLDDIVPTLVAPRGLDLRQYIDAILRRFRNRAIQHPLAQIAWDGSQKLPFRLFGTITDALAAGHSIERLCVPIAAWMQFVRSRALQGERVVDPWAEKLFDIGRATEGRSGSDLRRFFELESVFPAELIAEPRFTAALARAYDGLAAADITSILTAATATGSART
ncbi:MAG TPA: mannitol dehydrogenase family protein [Steroidobacteraceae bacterium]|nr:mannitol dehydrogenase family protein [Steroidobacteraceae bacterium]